MSPALLLRWALRESRGARGRLMALTACLALGVGAVVAVTSSVAAIGEGVGDRARDLLGADLVVSSHDPMPEVLDAVLAEVAPGARRTDVIEIRSMAAAPADEHGPGRSTLIELKVVSGPFPFYGDLTLDPPGELHAALDEHSAIVAPALLSALGLERGGTLRIGGVDFTIARTVVSEPDRLGISFTLGPRVFLSREGFERTDLLGFASRVDHKAMLALPPGVDEQAVAERLRVELDDPTVRRRVETGADGQPSVRRALERVERTLGLMALLSLVLGGIGVSQVVRAWLGTRTASVATMRCLGMRPAEILVVFLGQVALLACAGCVVGAVAGASVPWVLPSLVPDAVPADLVHPFQPVAWLRGMGLGIGLALVFAAPPLAAVWRVSPARVLRAEAAPLPTPRGVVVACLLALVLGVFFSAVSLGERFDLAGWFTGILAGTALILLAVARGVMFAVGRLPRGRVGPTLRHGLAALARPGAGTVGAVTALGLGVLVVLSVAVVGDRLAYSLRSSLPENAPTAFLVDIQPDQWIELEPLLEQRAPGAVRSVPVVMARLASVDGVGTDELARRWDEEEGEDRGGAAGAAGDDGRRGGGGADRGRADGGGGGDGRAGGGGRSVGGGGGGDRGDDDRGGDRGSRDERGGGGRDDDRGGRGRWVLTREQRLTWMAELGDDNQITAGTLWADDAHDEVSLEEGYAESLHATLGTELVFDVQGVPVPLTVTSLRTVEWRSFAINFFLVVEPGVLDDAPHFRIATVRATPADQQALQDVIAQRFPNITLLDVREILGKVADLLGSLAGAIGVMGLLTVLTGLGVLAGSVASTSMQRGREAALLKTLGLTRRGVAGLFATEHALLGLVAGLVGGSAGMLLAWGFLVEVAELNVELPWMAVPATAVATAVLAALCGVAACRGALRQPPLASLRG